MQRTQVTNKDGWVSAQDDRNEKLNSPRISTERGDGTLNGALLLEM